MFRFTNFYVIRKLGDEFQVSAVLTPEINTRHKLDRRLVGSQA